MNIFKISFKNILGRPLNALLTIIMLTMGVALTSLLIMVSASFDESFKKNIRGVDMVVGAKGSPLQLILSAVYQIDNPTGNIPKKEADKLSKNPMVAETVQLSFGDSYKGRKIVGTSHAYLELYGAKMADGKPWSETFEAVVGATVAAENGLNVGDTFYSAHGADENAEVHGDHPFTVTGVLEPNGTVLDRLLLTSPQSIWDVHHSEPISDEEKEITAMLVKFKNKMGMISLPRMVNKNTNMQAALPSIEVNRLFELFGIGIATLQTVAIVLMVLGGISVFVSLLNSLKDRAYEIALMRSMGASRGKVYAMIIIEALLLGLIGVFFGLLIAHVGAIVLDSFTAAELGIQFDLFAFYSGELYLVLATFSICFLAALFPAVKTVKMDVSNVLSTYAN
ncbi:MAG: ABC transporter permease [Cryomorphaceae bacterium]|nr:ABC transporter permease [Flavobacteriales bacterium]